jgi:cytochrome c oxidase subunit II
VIQQSVLDPAGPDARSIAIHWWVMLAIGSIVLLIVVAAFVHAIFRAPRTTPPDALPAQSVDGESTRRRKSRAVTVAIGVTVVILIAVMIHGIVLTGETLSRRHAAALEIDVTGHQWWWEVRYRDPRVDRQFITANEVHIPVGEPVRFELTSQDVIHSFWVPRLAGKIDIPPGDTNEIWLVADEPGVYIGLCAEFCGWFHADMRFRLVVGDAGDCGPTAGGGGCCG